MHHLRAFVGILKHILKLNRRLVMVEMVGPGLSLHLTWVGGPWGRQGYSAEKRDRCGDWVKGKSRCCFCGK